MVAAHLAGCMGVAYLLARRSIKTNRSCRDKRTIPTLPREQKKSCSSCPAFSSKMLWAALFATGLNILPAHASRHLPEGVVGTTHWRWESLPIESCTNPIGRLPLISALTHVEVNEATTVDLTHLKDFVRATWNASTVVPRNLTAARGCTGQVNGSSELPPIVGWAEFTQPLTYPALQAVHDSLFASNLVRVFARTQKPRRMKCQLVWVVKV